MTHAELRLYYLLNASDDRAEDAALMLRASVTVAIMTDKRGGAATGRDGPYARFALPTPAPWKCVLPKENV